MHPHPITVSKNEGQYIIVAAQVDTTMPVHTLIAAAPCTSWGPAELAPVVQYLRGVKQLRLPAEVRAIFPDMIGEGTDPVQSRMVF